MDIKEETNLNNGTPQYGYFLEESASDLTKGYGRRMAEANGKMMI